MVAYRLCYLNTNLGCAHVRLIEVLDCIERLFRRLVANVPKPPFGEQAHIRDHTLGLEVPTEIRFCDVGRKSLDKDASSPGMLLGHVVDRVAQKSEHTSRERMRRGKS